MTHELQAELRLVRARRGLLLPLGILVLWMPLAGSVEAVSSYSYLAPGPQLYSVLAATFALDGLLPSLAVNAAVVALFPSWRVLRLALPAVAALTLVGWAAWFWMFFGPYGKFPNYPLAQMRWPLVVAGPLGIVTATAFIFLLARVRLAGHAPRVS